MKGRGPSKQVRATLAFRQRHFVGSNTGGFILTFVMSNDIITACCCGVQSCPRASLPPSRGPARPTYEFRRAEFRRQDPRDENLRLMPKMEDSSLRRIFACRFAKCPPLWWLTNTLVKVRSGAVTLRDVKNQDRSGYVHENTGDDDKMSG